MKGRIGFTISCLLMGLFLMTALHGEAKWEKVKSGSGVTVFTRDVEGSDLDEFMGVTYINTNIVIVMAVLQDIPAQTQWMKDCIESKLIEKKSDLVRIVYNVTDTPWPVTDRDVVVKTVTKMEPSKGRVITSIQSINDPRVPPKSGRVRMASLVGSWSVYYLGENKVKVVYKIKANPGGSIPSSLANMTSKKIPYETLIGLKRMVKMSKYAAEAKNLEKTFGTQKWVVAK